jgi:hypothetical protein
MISKTAPALLLALLVAAALSACGGGSTATGQQATTSPPGQKDCDAKGINRIKGKEGTCFAHGSEHVVVNHDHFLRLPTIGVAITGLATVPQIPSSQGTLTPQNGTFLLMKLAVDNRDKVPHRFAAHGPGQVMLTVGNRQYVERLDVERSIGSQSLLSTAGGVIAPGDRLEGNVVFDVQQSDLQEMQQDGQLVVVDFDKTMLSKKPPKVIGQIRLYR